ncbi:hypothetical protein C900_03740 [Fulvivirga imtechensis AK7]|uniref:Uncharacterized protein n=2 Tax=Fulvivirga TaxID=396811 RepID=L8JN67_9BACT|nr:hypothetical protein C900_03740 [Fulvivirga imtechensis AK7]
MAIVAITFFKFTSIYAQDDIDQLLESSLSDANKLIEGYIDPFMKGFGTGLGSGWYNTAKAHKTAGFDLTATVNLAYVPDKDMFYNINSSLENTQLISPSEAPTIFGPDEEPTYQFTYTDSNTGETITDTFTGPPGLNLKDDIGFNAVPVPMIQLGIGIVKNTDLKIRWTPKIDMGDGTLKVIGFGVMHDVKQHIPGIKNLPFDLSAFIGFTDITTDVDLDDDTTVDNKGEFDINTWTFQGIISKKFSVLTLYGGLGFNRVRSELKMLGEYEVGSGTETEIIENPVDLSFKSGGPRLTAGMRIKLAILTLHADYTLQQYKTLTVGVGFSVR